MERCHEWGTVLNLPVLDFSVEKYGLPLCIEHQKWITYMTSVTTGETIRLYFALKQRGVPACLEKYDGYKHIDIAIPDAKINIEVDGGHHNYNHQQA